MPDCRFVIGSVPAELGREQTLVPAAMDDCAVIARLERAGMTLLALPSKGYTTHLRTGGLEFVREAMEGYGWSEVLVRPATPSARDITAMDEAYSWLRFIPADRFVLRRILGARSLVHPVTDRHLFPWRRIGKALGCDHRAVQRWHADAIALITRELSRRAAPVLAAESFFQKGCSNGPEKWH
jgi:hypothetical protein